jgi:hypothetical protein
LLYIESSYAWSEQAAFPPVEYAWLAEFPKCAVSLNRLGVSCGNETNPSLAPTLEAAEVGVS